jgi:predicted DNA-binding antitoxin AbrB/MazE fold protein
MNLQTDAVFEDGVLRPLVPLNLREHEVVSLFISAPSADKSVDDETTRQRSVVLAYVEKLEARSDVPPSDGFSNRDHDRLIYGQ